MVLDYDNGQLRRDRSSSELFRVLSPEVVRRRMQQIVDNVGEVLQLPQDQLQLLLNRFKWDKDLLLERYYEGDNDEFLRSLNIHVKPKQRETQQQRHRRQLHQHQHQHQQQQQHLCEICFCDAPIDDMMGLGCGHEFCGNCWTQYLQEKMTANGQFTDFQCPAFGCEALADDEAVERHLVDPRLVGHFRKAALTNFVACTRRLAFCPGLDCPLVVEQLDDASGSASLVRCTCGKTFCFACSQDWHDPISCAMLKAWLEKNADESMNTQWFMANTKECPKCRVTIEKSGGCNHMVCRSVSCKHEFCWVCMDDWKPHGNQWYNCNRFDQARAERLRKEQAFSRDYLARYLHYYDLYMNHLKSLEFEARLLDTVKQKMSEIQFSGVSWVESKFLIDAAEVLCNCRRVLMYTYVFAYYLKPSNQQTIFEANQRNLQLSTEALSETLERELNLANFQQLKQSVQDKYRFCQSRTSALLEHVLEGQQMGWWSFDFSQSMKLKADAEQS